MKTIPLAFAGMLCLTFAACDSKPAPSGTTAPAVSAPKADPKAAFAASLNALADEVNALEKEHKDTNPMEMMKKLPGILAKLDKVSTEGLPEDLAAAFVKVQKNSSAMGAIIAKIPTDLPSDPAQMGTYMQAHPEVMKTMMEMQGQIEPLKAEGDAAKKELEAAAVKHDIDITKFIKAGENSETK